MPRRKRQQLSEAAKNAEIDRGEFDSVMKKLLQAKRPTAKDEIAKRPSAASHAGKRSDQR